jgi:hypothetical protein
MKEKKNKKVCLRIDGVNHHLCKYKGWVDGGKYNWACPNCSLYKTHFKYCWNIDDAKGGSPLCSILASANNWDEDFAVYFKTINRKQRR